MKNSIIRLFAAGILAVTLISCSKYASGPSYYMPDNSVGESDSDGFDLSSLARMFAALPIGVEQMEEVMDAALSSIGNGYDEEYTMKQLIEAPGCGVGDSPTKAGSYARPLRDMIAEYLGTDTKAGAQDVEQYLNALSESDLQIYWPYSEDWDGEELPIITFDPGYGSEYNYGYRIGRDPDGFRVVDSVYVDELIAREHPVWVINKNDDADHTPLALYETAFTPDHHLDATSIPGVTHDLYHKVAPDPDLRSSTKSGPRMLYLRSFTMLRQYDSWFRGGSEFFVKCGAVNGFHATTEAEMRLYYPSVTDFMVVVKRKQLGEEIPYNGIIMTDFTNQLENLAFLITEDDGGTQTSWKCSATVKVKSRSYGFDVDIPYNEKDDIVWRGQLSANFFQEADFVTGRFGDVMITFALE
ncbi:MAG: hypothetical protein J5748_02365 [Bacteroidales bacterium]|nr:hypothetical protein [Bacteroidales bacterium]